MDKRMRAGKIAFSSMTKSILEVSDYYLKIDSNINTGTRQGIKSAKLKFRVDCERVLLAHEQVYSTYPPKNFSGNYRYCLPHIILQRCTFPWERKLKLAEADIPWVALLVFSHEEGVNIQYLDFDETTQGFPAEVPEDVYVPREYTQLLAEGAAVGKQLCVMDIPTELFVQVLPTLGDLKYLAHSRNVSLDDKVTDSGVADGWFSCVTANRHPRDVFGTEAEAPHLASLVSLEGFEELLGAQERMKIVGKYCYVRMFSLYAWNFNCKKQEMDFVQCAGRLSASALCMDTAQVEEPDLKAILEKGYCAVDYYLREGSQSVAWYHSPLVPYKPGEDTTPFGLFADALLRYDETQDMFDITYSSAWQLGRMLALQNQAFAQALIHWRFKNKEDCAVVQIKQQILQKLQPIQSDEEAQADEIPWESFVSDITEDFGISDKLELKSMDISEESLEDMCEAMKDKKINQANLVAQYLNQIR